MYVRGRKHEDSGELRLPFFLLLLALLVGLIGRWRKQVSLFLLILLVILAGPMLLRGYTRFLSESS